MGKKKSPLAKLKEKLWKQISLYVRLKDADCHGYVQCVTCKTRHHWKEMQAGHFIDGHNNTVMFDLRLIHPQCRRCNLKTAWGLSGNKVAYTVYMMDIGYTKEDIETFERMKMQSKKFDLAELEQMLEEITHKLESLLQYQLLNG